MIIKDVHMQDLKGDFSLKLIVMLKSWQYHKYIQFAIIFIAVLVLKSGRGSKKIKVIFG